MSENIYLFILVSHRNWIFEVTRERHIPISSLLHRLGRKRRVKKTGVPQWQTINIYYTQDRKDKILSTGPRNYGLKCTHIQTGTKGKYLTPSSTYPLYSWPSPKHTHSITCVPTPCPLVIVSPVSLNTNLGYLPPSAVATTSLPASLWQHTTPRRLQPQLRNNQFTITIFGPQQFDEVECNGRLRVYGTCKTLSCTQMW